MSSTKPKFAHDCEVCKFLGHFNDHDVYSCNSMASAGFGDTLVARYGSDGPDYTSVPRSLFRTRILEDFERTNGTVYPTVREHGKPLPYEIAWLCALVIEVPFVTRNGATA